MSLASCLKKLKGTVSVDDAALINDIYGDLRTDMAANLAAIQAVEDVYDMAAQERAEIVAKIEKAGGVVPASAFEFPESWKGWGYPQWFKPGDPDPDGSPPMTGGINQWRLWGPSGPVGAGKTQQEAYEGYQKWQKHQDSLEAEEGEEAANKGQPVDVLAERLLGDGFTGIVDARKFAAGHGMPNEGKAFDELLEQAVVQAARDIAQSDDTQRSKFERLVTLYENQPNLSSRTAESVAKQAYSTPVPLAYVASRLAGVSDAKVVYEPTAGNGALLIEADPESQTVIANELDETRYAALKAQGFKATKKDATKLPEDHEADSIIMNPPFGAVWEGGKTQQYEFRSLTTSAVDHAISVQALTTLNDDGRAVLILGGVKAESEEERRKGYRGKAKREFFFYLYNNFNVVDHFTVDGDLYRKQGAGWPVDVIVIEGRGKSELKLPAANPPTILKSWDDVKGKLPNARQTTQENGELEQPLGGASEGVGQPGVGHEGGGLHDDGKRTSTRRSGSGEPGEVRPSGVGGQRTDVRPDADNVPGRPAGDGERGGSDQSSTAEQQRTGLEAGKSAAANVGMGVADVAKGFDELFNPKNKLGSGPTFDEETYRKSLPYFKAGVAHFKQAGADVTEMVRALVRHLVNVAKLTRETIEAMKPYIARFVKDVKSGKETIADKPKPVIGKANTAGQVLYRPASTSTSLNSLSPQNIEGAINGALLDFEAKNGLVDSFVAERLGYEVAQIPDHYSAEQVDAIALAINNIEKGSGFILGDQTGMGKGRVVAAIIRYAIRQGIKPVFVTSKPDLYGDMFRDMNDIGMTKFLGHEPTVWMTNTLLHVPLDEEALDWAADKDEAEARDEKAPKRTGKFLSSGGKAKQLKAMEQILAGTDNFDMIFTTYSQMQTINSGQETDRRKFMRRAISDSLIILDESHNAGGQGAKEDGGWTAKDEPQNRAEFFREIIGKAKGVVFSSATYAKSPTVMDLYASTDMSKAVADPKELPKLITSGGVPMQQIIAANLAESGQYVRRERTFDGIEYEVEAAPVDEDAYAEFSGSIRAVFGFDLAVGPERDHLMQEVLDEAGAAQSGQDNAIGDMGANVTEFSSIMHNIINQMLLSIKAGAVAERAVKSLQAGEKPVIVLANTNESFIGSYALEEEIGFGDEINISFADVLQRYLDRTLRITIKDGEGNKSWIYIPVSKLSPGLQAQYREVKKLISEGDFSSLPVSPIDHMRNIITKAGYSVAEVTGRKGMIDYSTSPPTYIQRPKAELGSSGKRVTVANYNKGTLDTVIINQSAAEGISMHSDQHFADQRPRRMLIAQPEANIDIYMQLLGRINRTGQVVLPAYTQMAAQIPAEIRPTAVLMNKMASLNANTTAARGSIFSVKAVDFMNAYGDQVVATVLDEDPMLHSRLGGDVLKYEGQGVKMRLKYEGTAKRATGRLTLLEPSEQQRMMDKILEDYETLLAALDEAGENTLEAKNIDLQARPIEKVELRAKVGEGPFLEGIWIEEMSIKAEGRAMRADDLIQAIGDALKHGTAAENYEKFFGENYSFEQKLEKMGWLKEGIDKKDLDVSSASKDTTDFINLHIEEIEKRAWKTLEDMPDEVIKIKAGDPSVFRDQTDEKIKIFKDKTGANYRQWLAIRNAVPVGAKVNITLGDEEVSGIVIKVKKKLKSTANPTALSGWEVTFAVPDSRRVLTVPFSQVYPSGRSKPAAETGYEISGEYQSYSDLMPQFEEAATSGRDNRNIITGNILAGFDLSKGLGQIVHFTMEDGSVRQGILMARGFKIQKFMQARAVRFKTMQQVIKFMDAVPEAEVHTANGNIMLSRLRWDKTRFTIDIDARRGKGGRFYTDPSVIRAVAPQEMEKQGTMMSVDVDEAPFKKAVSALIKIGAKFETTEEQDTAKGIVEAGAKQYSAFGPRLTPGAQAARPLMEEKVIEIIRRMGGDDIALQLDDVIERPGGRVGGFYNHYDRIIGIAMADGFDPINAALHEGWHSVERLMTKREKALMKAEMPRLRGIVARNLADYGVDRGVIDKMSNTEVLAEAAAAHLQRGLPGVHIGIRRFFDRLARIVRQIRNAMRGLGFNTAEDVFDIAGRGEMKTRGPQPRPLEATGEQYAAHGQRPPDPNANWITPNEASWTARHLLKNTSSIAGHALPQIVMNKGIVRQKFQDRMNSVRRMQSEIEKIHGDIPEHLSTYLAEELYHGKAGELQQAFILGHLDPLTAEMRARDITFVEMGNYLYARHAPERNEFIEARNPAIGDEGSGMPDAEAAQIMAQIATEGRTADFEAIARRVDRITKDSLLRQLRGGLISRETYDELTARWQFYVPLKGFEDEITDNSEIGRSGYDIRGRESQIAFGRKSKSDNPLVYVVNDAERSILRSEKNRVAQTFLRMVRAYPNSQIWKIYKGTLKQVINPDTGLTEKHWVGPWVNTPDNVISAKVNGKVTYIQIYHDGVLRGMKNLGTDNTHGAVKAFGMFNRYLARMNTSLNPGFILRNFTKDLQTAAIHLGELEEDGLRKKVLFDVSSAVSGVFGGLKGKADTDWQKHFHEYAQAGGKVSYFDMDSVESKSQKIQLALKDHKMYNALKWTWDLIDQSNGAVENGVRLSAFVHLRRLGYSKAEAASFARNMTVNFNRKGEWGATLNAFSLFYNAGIQGPARMFQFAKRNPKLAAKVYLGMASTAFALDLLNYWIAPDDDDGENVYDKIPDHMRERNLIIMIPGRDFTDGRIPISGKDYIKIPLTWGYNALFVIGQQAGSLVRQANGYGAERLTKSGVAANIVSAAINGFLPVSINPESFLQTIVPTAGKPIVELSQNSNWWGGPIYKTVFPGQEATPQSQRYFTSINPTLRELTTALNEWTGGNEGRSGKLDVNPEAIDHMLTFLTGGAGKFFVDYIYGNAARIIEGEEIPAHKIPFLRSFYGKIDSYADRNIFYQELDQVRALDFEINRLQDAGQGEKADAARDRDPRLTEVLGPFKGAEKQLRELRQHKRAIEAGKRTPEDKKAALERVKLQEEEAMTRARKAWNKAYKVERPEEGAE